MSVDREGSTEEAAVGRGGTRVSRSWEGSTKEAEVGGLRVYDLRVS